VGEGEDDGVGGVSLETKRRRWGRFIGLRGCESPVVQGDRNALGREGEGEEEHDEDGLVERMEREWRRTLERRQEEERLREKEWRARW